MSKFDASASALGFLHQVRWAMYELLITSKRSADQSVRMTLEVFDDVGLTDSAGNPLKAIQLKQHASNKSLTNGSVDLWKTIRVWLQTKSLADPEGPLLTLMTTSSIPNGSAAHFLGTEKNERDVAKALRLLNTAAKSGSKETQAGRTAWQEAPASTRASLLTRTRILGDQASIHEIDALLDAEIAPLVSSKYSAEYRSRLWGWWDNQAIWMLRQNKSNPASAFVSASDLYARMQLIRDDFRADKLNVDMTLGVDDEKLTAGYDQHFVTKLKAIQVNDGTLKRAVVDYLRAYAHTAKWVQDGDLFDDELERYKTDLKDEWDRRFDEMLEDLETGGVDDPLARSTRGRALFRALGDSVEVTIRPEFKAAFHARGARNEIANGKEHGWHPDFRSSLASVLTGSSNA